MKLPANTTRALCLTPACVQLAQEYVANLAPNYRELDACTDFDEYVCGGWRARHEFPAGQGRITALGQLQNRGLDTLRQILEGPYPEASDHSHFSPRNLARAASSIDQQNFEMLQRAYGACMDEAAIAAAGTAPLVNLTREMQATFGSDDGKDGEDWSRSNVLLWQLNSYGLGHVLVTTEVRDPLTPMPMLVPVTGLGLGRADYYNTTDTVAEYASVVEQVLGAVLPADFSPNTSTIAAAAAEFEAALATLNADVLNLSEIRVGSTYPQAPRSLTRCLLCSPFSDLHLRERAT